MKEKIRFNTEIQMDKSLSESFLYETFKPNSVIWVKDFFKFASKNKVDAKSTYVSLKVSGKGFKYYYAISDSYTPDLTLRTRIEILRELAKALKIKILSTDDELNPFSRVLIEPDGETSTIQTQLKSLIVDRFYNFFFGEFRTKNKLNEQEILDLRRLLIDLYPNIELEQLSDGPVFGGAFNQAKENIEKLRDFDYHYRIKPIGKNRWLDIEEKSEIFISVMKELNNLWKQDICAFPRNFSKVETIEGGSDSEEHCIVLTNLTQEKIIYKQRRKSWLEQ